MKGAVVSVWKGRKWVMIPIIYNTDDGAYLYSTNLSDVSSTSTKSKRRAGGNLHVHINMYTYK